MVTINGSYQYIDWSHGPVNPEPYEHFGTLETFIINPGITIGLTEYLNFEYNQILGVRSMYFGPDATSIHHDTETSLTDYENDKGFRQAVGGLLGDARFKIKYLYKNVGMKEGSRMFFGLGMSVPSKNMLTESPFLVSEEDWPEDNEDWTGQHRHFSISEGVKKGVLELQYYKKRTTTPVFIGGSITMETPLSENEYGYRASQLYDANITALTKKISKIGASVGGNLSIRQTTQSYWNQKPSPNSKATIFSPGISFLWNIKMGGLALGIQKPIFIYGGMSGTESENLDQKMNAWQITLSYRRVLDFIIPWLDPLKDL